MDKTSQGRKDTPVFSGVLRYFPDAIAAVARVSKAGNDKHNPGEPLHWARGKSDDHGDCIVRHQLEFDVIDPDMNEFHAAMVAWRALAQLQLLEEIRCSHRSSCSPPMVVYHQQPIRLICLSRTVRRTPAGMLSRIWTIIKGIR